MQLKSILCALHPLILATSVLTSTQPLTSTTFTMCYFYSWKYHSHIRTTLCVVSILETCTDAAPTLRVRIPSSIAIMSYSTYPYPIKLQLFQLILPTAFISALKRDI